MKIAILSRYQNTIERGAETFVNELTSQLASEYSVTVLAGSDADNLTKIIRGNYDFVISINGGLQAIKAGLGRVFGGYKLVITGQAGIGRGEILNLVFARPDVYVALTKTMANWVKKWAWGSKVAIIPNGIDVSKFHPKGEKIDFGVKGKIILSVGALTWYKHHEKTIQAVARLEDASLVLVGRGDRRSELKELGEKLLGKRFRILESAYKDLPKIYRSADLFVLPSWSREAFGIVYLEAMASGLGVVAPNDESRREIIGHAGILTDVDDASKYADDIKNALEQEWMSKATDQARKFSWSYIAVQYHKLFESLR